MTDISSLFPLEATITQEILDRCSPMNPARCQGTLTLKQALGDWANDRQIFWGASSGEIDNISITTVENIDLHHVVVPTKVTFVVKT